MARTKAPPLAGMPRSEGQLRNTLVEVKQEHIQVTDLLNSVGFDQRDTEEIARLVIAFRVMDVLWARSDG